MPKKRGRKKKQTVVESDVGQANTIEALLDQEAACMRMAQERSSAAVEPLQGRRAQQCAALWRKAEIFDKKTDSNEFIERIHDRLMQKRYSGYLQRDEGHDAAFQKIYEYVKNHTNHNGLNRLWNNTITKYAAEKICSIINHFILSGPLSEGEIDILDRCVILLKAYYADRANLIKKDKANKGYYYRSTYFPPSNTFAYRIFVSKYDMPKKQSSEHLG